MRTFEVGGVHVAEAAPADPTRAGGGDALVLQGEMLLVRDSAELGERL